MITTGIFPDAFKVSKVTPIFKKGDCSLMSNYRPISLLPTISKIFERVIHDQMYEYFNEFNLLAEQQYGFRKKNTQRSTLLKKLIDHVSKQMENGKTPGNLYIDLSKAFDTLAFDILLFKLKYYGVTDTALDLMSSYPKNRKQYVVFNNTQSEYSEVYTGVPQGSILGPLFFSICINDLITASDKLKFLMYADDTTIYFNLEDFDSHNTEADINAELEKVNTWLKLNKLSLNAQKTKLMLFHRKQKHVTDVNVKIDNTMIERVQTFNFLGVMLKKLYLEIVTKLWLVTKFQKLLGFFIDLSMYFQNMCYLHYIILY